jgi:hypothetical protein
MVKICKLCELEKPSSDFYLFHDKWGNKKYFSARCKPCHQKYKQENPSTPKTRKVEKLKLRYGLTFEQWEEMREEVGFSCMICGIPESEIGRRLDVDHCHNSGKVRGLLCNHCNGVLGQARDNPEILTSAIEYLKTYGGGYKTAK